jgi:hypothetical protein
MLIALALASVLVSEDPDGVVSTAPRVGVGAVLVGAEAPTTDARPDAAQVVAATPHNLTTREQIDRWVSARSEEAVPFAEATGPEDDRKMHGYVSGAIGTGDYSAVEVGVSLPVGENGRLNLSYSQSKNDPYAYGYGYLGYGYGYGPFDGYGYGHGYRRPFDSFGASSRSRSMSLGFSWDEDRENDRDRDPRAPLRTPGFSALD